MAPSAALGVRTGLGIVAPGAFFHFTSTNIIGTDITVAGVPTSTFTLNTPGVYKVSYTIRAEPGAASAVGVYVNVIPIAGTSDFVPSGGGLITGTGFFTHVMGATNLNVMNVGMSPILLTATQDSFRLLIERIQ